MVLKQMGYSVLLIERAKHRRFVIGESSTPFANLLLERIAEKYNLPELRPLCEWGSWQKNYPRVGCGLKRGFSFFHHECGKELNLADRQRQLLVAASPNNELADTHWYRPDFDDLLVQLARKRGVVYQDEFRCAGLERNGDWQIRNEEGRSYSARFLVDASGCNSVLAHHFGVASKPFDFLPETTAIYAHFVGVGELEFGAAQPPYPPEAAAVHHVFPGGWLWILRFNNGITSAGAALTSAVAAGQEEDAWNELLNRLPSVSKLFRNSRRTTPLLRSAPLSFRRERCRGEGWAALPSAVGFVDPLLSTGFALTLAGILRFAECCRSGLPSFSRLEQYEEKTLAELDAAALLIGAMYSRMNSPGDFNRLALLYFAAMSFTETAWRLGREELASEFLLNNNQDFRTAREKICREAIANNFVSGEEILQTIRPFDIAGLSDESRKNWHGVDLNDLFRGAARLGSTQTEIEEMLRRCGIK